MNRFWIVLVLFVSVTIVPMKGQTKADLLYYNDIMANAYEFSTRQKAFEYFGPMFEKELKQKGFKEDFSYLKWISIKTPSDQSFRIITWPIKQKDDHSKYYGYLQMADGTLYPLQNNAEEYQNPYYQAGSPDFWYGALYYNLMETGTEKDKSYLLFGYNAQTDHKRVKIIDVLHFENGKPVFGKDIFKFAEAGEKTVFHKRVLIDYAATANVNCNYDSDMKMIVHDFVVEGYAYGQSEEVEKIPDGTYVGYKWDGENWCYVERIANEISKPEDIFYQPKPATEEPKDLFGRKKKN